MSYVVAQQDDPDGPWPHFLRVLAYPELDLQAQLVGQDVEFAFMMYAKVDGWTRQGKSVFGMAHMPAVNGTLSSLFEQLLEDALGYWPDFLIILNADWWSEASDLEREILVFHEVKHCGQALDKFGEPKFRKSDGAPVLSIVGHDIEEFNDVVARYGAWKSDLRDFLAAVDAGPPVASNAKVMDAGDFADLAREIFAEVDIATATPAMVRAVIDRKLDELSAEEAAEALSVAPRVDDDDPLDDPPSNQLGCDIPPRADSCDDVF